MSSSDLSTLINSDRVRSSIRRLFTGAISEILGELFQNSQRARASAVTLTTTEMGFTYEDNGHGLLGGVEGFHTLLKIAESHFDNPTLEAQDPIGLGMHALLAHEQITQVRFESGLLGLTIVCERWWSDQAYYSSWFERLEPLSDTINGLRIVVACLPDLCERMRNTLAAYESSNPARGYADLLSITLDNQPVMTALPAWITQGTVLIETLYQGCPLTVRFVQDQRVVSAVNWYGQLIKDLLSDSFSYYLHVRDGRPLHPLSPSRHGLIDDAARAALIAFIKEHLFGFLFDPANRAMIRPEWVAAYYDLDRARAMREAPYFVAAPLLSGPIGSVEDLNRQDQPCILTYNVDHPLLLAPAVMTLLPPTSSDQQDGTDAPQAAYFEYGRDSFLPLLGAAYTLLSGNEERLSIATLWWKVGPRREDTLHLAGSANEMFHHPGSWGISFNDAEPERWQPVTTTTVFVFNEPSSWDVDQVDFLVGTSDPLAFYQDAAWAGFDPEDDDYDYHQIQEAYAESCATHIRALIGDAIPFSFTLSDIQAKMQDKRSRILSVHYHYPPRQKGCATPIAITARNQIGERKRLKLVS